MELREAPWPMVPDRPEFPERNRSEFSEPATDLAGSLNLSGEMADGSNVMSCPAVGKATKT
jgi:hypothetical protein